MHVVHSVGFRSVLVLGILTIYVAWGPGVLIF